MLLPTDAFCMNCLVTTIAIGLLTVVTLLVLTIFSSVILYKISKLLVSFNEAKTTLCAILKSEYGIENRRHNKRTSTIKTTDYKGSTV